jgi:hypothetical protein
MPTCILDPNERPHNRRGKHGFRVDTPGKGLEGQRGFVANMLVQIGDRQEQLQ